MNGKKEGIGTYVWQDKTVYQGEWKENNINGFGMFYYPDGRSYIGELHGSQMHGYGEFIWKEGKKYFGYYSHDKKHGFGIYFWPNDKFYVGFWKNGKQHGAGKHIKGNKISFGKWNEGKKETKYETITEFNGDLNKEEHKYIYFLNLDVENICAFMNNGILS